MTHHAAKAGLLPRVTFLPAALKRKISALRHAKGVELHLEEFLDVVHNRTAPAPLSHLWRTLSAPRRIQFPFLSLKTMLSEIEQEHARAFEDARYLVHIETQFFRARSLADKLAHASRRNPVLHAIIILRGLPNEVAFSESIGSDARYGMALQQDALSSPPPMISPSACSNADGLPTPYRTARPPASHTFSKAASNCAIPAGESGSVRISMGTNPRMRSTARAPSALLFKRVNAVSSSMRRSPIVLFSSVRRCASCSE